MIEHIIQQNFWYRNLQRLVLGGPPAGTAVAVANKIRRFLAHRAKSPSSLVLFVTNRCQMACPFCFFQNSLNRGDSELSLEEITKLATSLKTIRRLSLTGGEPFLRKDLTDICRAFRRACPLTYLNIPTNGMLTGSIADQVLGILDTVALTHFKVQISLDALGSSHDRLRNTPRAFDRALDTLAALRQISRKHPRFTVEIAANVNTLLITEIKEYVSFFSSYKVPLKFSIIRDGSMVTPIGISGAGTNPHHTEVTGQFYPTLDQLKSFYTSLEGLNRYGAYPFWSTTQRLKFKYSLDILEKRCRLFPCYAGSVEAVIYHTGEVGLCEYTPPVGNLRDFDLNFNLLWHSAEAGRLRNSIQSCACIHGCNLLTSLSYDDKSLTAILSPHD